MKNKLTNFICDYFDENSRVYKVKMKINKVIFSLVAMAIAIQIIYFFTL